MDYTSLMSNAAPPSGPQPGPWDAMNQIVPPPANPSAPPEWLAKRLVESAKHTADWAKLPGDLYSGLMERKPSTPGQWSDEDEAVKQLNQQHMSDWASSTAANEVFWPRTGTNVGGSGFAVGSGAIPPAKAAIADVPGLTKQLEAALHSKNVEEFPTIFKSLGDLSEADAKSLAKQFYGGGSPRSKKQALDLVWERWRKLQDFRKSTSADKAAF